MADERPEKRGLFGVRRALRRGASGLRDRIRRERTPSEPASIRFDGGAQLSVEAGVTVLAAAKAAGVDITHYCGGTCSCGTCRVEIVSGAEQLAPAAGREQMVLGAENTAAGDRLACQARVLGPVHVRVPDWF